MQPTGTALGEGQECQALSGDAELGQRTASQPEMHPAHDLGVLMGCCEQGAAAQADHRGVVVGLRSEAELVEEGDDAAAGAHLR